MIEFIVIATLLFILYIVEKKSIKLPVISKHNESLTLILILLMVVIIMGGNNKNPDTIVYKNMYLMKFYNKNIGFGYLIQLSKNIGLSLDLFRLIIAIIGILLINSVVRQYLPKRFQILFYFFYFIYPFFIDIVQIRNFISMAILVYALNILKDGTIKSKIYYSILILLASSLHSVFIVYLPLVFIEYIFKNRRVKYIVYVFFAIILLLSLNRDFVNVLVQAFSPLLLDSIQDIDHYITQSTSFGGYVRWGICLINIYLVNYSYGYLSNRKSNVGILNLTKYVLWANIYSMLFLPMVLITLDFYRIQRNLTILNYLIYIYTIYKLKMFDEVKKNLFYIILITIVIGISFVFLFVIDNSLSDIIIAILKNNWILHRG